jgi:hypothetical protein
MLEPDESMLLESDFTDDHLRFIEVTFGPEIKDMLLLPGPVSIHTKEVPYAATGSD